MRHIFSIICLAASTLTMQAQVKETLTSPNGKVKIEINADKELTSALLMMPTNYWLEPLICYWKAPRTSNIAAHARNHYVAELANTIVFGMLPKDSSLYEIYMRHSEDASKQVKLIKADNSC